MTFRITVLPNKTFRGVLHFEECDYDASTELARHAVKEGVAKWNFAKMPADQLNDWYEQTVGYRPQVDEPNMTDDELRALCVSYVKAVEEESE